MMVVALKESIMGTMKMMQGDDNHGGSVVLEGGEVVVGEGEVLEEEEEEGVELPGFRFHPTDEELVTFYLRRKVAGKRLSIEIIKEMDIYKHEPSDLPKTSTVGGGDKEWYFFCLRGRKYRNSVRPNRVTGAGFWKATGIDRPIHGSAGIVGLKKSLVYYRGSAGKGVKTEWMMHEFRLPPNTAVNSSPCFQEAEVWTICRIFKRSVIYKKHPQQQQQHIAAAAPPPQQQQDSSSGVTGCGSLESSDCTGEYAGNYEYTMNNNSMPAPAPASGGAYYGGGQQQYFQQGMQWNDGGAMQQPVSDGDVWDDDIGRMVMELTDPSVFYDCTYA